MRAWLDDTCGSDGWEIVPAGMRGVVKDAIALYLREAAFVAAFAARWCRPAEDGCYRLRDDEPARRTPSGWHKTPWVPAPDDYRAKMFRDPETGVWRSYATNGEPIGPRPQGRRCAAASHPHAEPIAI